jgi:hypothetical protein
VAFSSEVVSSWALAVLPPKPGSVMPRPEPGALTDHEIPCWVPLIRLSGSLSLSGGRPLGGDHPVTSRAHPQASASRVGRILPTTAPLAPSSIFLQSNLLGCINRLDSAPLSTCLVVRSVIGWEEVSFPSVCDHVPVAKRRPHQPHVIVRISRVLHVGR